MKSLNNEDSTIASTMKEMQAENNVLSKSYRSRLH